MSVALNAMGAFYRRLRSRTDKPRAHTAALGFQINPVGAAA